jgi:hypothetical protein
MQIGGPCDGVTEIGYCAGDSLWVWCDPYHGLAWMDCYDAVGDRCYAVGQGVGACGCGPVDANGMCMQFQPSYPNEIHLYCISAYGVLGVSNCRARTGSPTGLCSTFVTSFGYQTSCMCDECVAHYAYAGVCESLCYGCMYDQQSNASWCP